MRQLATLLSEPRAVPSRARCSRGPQPASGRPPAALKLEIVHSPTTWELACSAPTLTWAPGRQLEALFHTPQRRPRSAGAPAAAPAPAGRQLAVLDLKRATAIGIRMSRMGCAGRPRWRAALIPW